jgi:hypothetical protein
VDTDQIIWIIVGVLGIGLVIGYFVQTADSRKISEILEKQALQRNGTVKAGSLISFPRLRFPYRDTTVEVSVLAGSSPVTWAEFSIDLAEISFRIRNRSAGLSAQKALGMMHVVPTGDPDFDERFFVEANHKSLVLSLLDGRLRADLLVLDTAYGQHKILVRLQPSQFQISVDTFGRDEEIFAGLIDTAIAFCDRLTKR